MRPWPWLSVLLVAACDEPGAPTGASSAAPSATSSAGPEEAAELRESRALVGRFSTALRQELMQALGASGPVGAVAVCSEKAPRIAEGLGLSAGWSIRRTSLKLRNPANAPDAWERAVLERFEQERARGVPADQLEFHEIVTTDGGRQHRYMKAIDTAAMCLGCHGTSISGELAAALDARYPDDKARGFAVGDIRGAFSVTKSL
jgi:hypothetical protein